MGMSSPGGLSAGTVTGRVEMDISSLIAAANQAKQLGLAFERALNGVNAPAQRAQSSINALGRDMLQLAGIASGVALARQFAQFAIQADATATAYGRQSIAAVELAGSQGKLTDLTEAYNKATGNQIDKANALNAVTRLMATGFADNTKELTTFVTASRGAALALGKTQEYIAQELQLTLSNTSERRLDQIGLGIEEVDVRVKALRASNSALTREMAFQQAVLGLMTEKYGKLATSTKAQATGAEGAARAWKDLGLAFGQLSGPTVSTVGTQLTRMFDFITAKIQASSMAIQDFGKWLQWLGSVTLPDSVRTQGREFMNSIGYKLGPTNPDIIGGPSRGERNRGVSGMGGRTEAQTDLIRQWATDVQAIEREAGASRVSATRQYEQQRAEVLSDYGRTVVREEQDFARNRLRAVQDYAKAVADAQADAAENEADAVRDYARAVASVREDAGKRDAKWQSDYSERIAELRADSNERLVELEEDYARARERAELDHRDRLLSAAARLDAVGVFEEQRNYARQQKDAEDNYSEQRSEIQEALAEQLADAKEAQDERLAEARAGDAERLADMQSAFDEQRAEARADAAQRLEDMQADFEERIAREDADRAVSLQRQAEDHAIQLAQMAQAQAERMAQIDQQVAQEKKSLEEKFLAELQAEGLYSENYLKIQAARGKASLDLFNKFWDEIERRFAVQGPKTKEEAGQTPQGEFAQTFADIIRTVQAKPGGLAMGGWVEKTGLSLVHAGEYMIPAGAARAMAGGMARNVTIGDVNVYASPGMNEQALAAAVRREIMTALEEAA